MALLTSREINRARFTLGEMWGLGRALSCSELADALEMFGARAGQAVHEMETIKPERITGPVSVAVRAMLDGWVPPCAPDGAEAAVERYASLNAA